MDSKHYNWAIKVASVVSERSKDPSTKVGAVIFDDIGRFVSAGFNGFPRGISDNNRLNDRLIKYRIVRHAEANALLFASRDVSGCTMFVTHACCVDCTCVIIQSGIKKVVFPKPSGEILSRWKDDFILSRKLFDEAGVEVVEVE